MILFLVPVPTEGKRQFSLTYTLVTHWSHIGHSYVTHHFEGRGAILWWVSSHRKYFAVLLWSLIRDSPHLVMSLFTQKIFCCFAVLLFCSDLTEAKERHITARSFRVLFRGASFDCISEYLKDINSFGTLQFCVTFWSSFFLFFFFFVLSTFCLCFLNNNVLIWAWTVYIFSVRCVLTKCVPP